MEVKYPKSAADRLYRFFSGQMHREVAAAISYPDPAERDFPPLITPAPDDDIVKDREPASWMDLPALLETYHRRARACRDNPSDMLTVGEPVHCFEGGIITAMLGGKVRWMGTRLHTYGNPEEPLIGDYRDFDWALPKEENVWFQRYLDAHRYFLEHAEGDFAIAYYPGMIGMNLAVQLRGADKAYNDLYEEPENLKRLLDYSLLLHVYIFGRVLEIVEPYNYSLFEGHPISDYRINRQPEGSVDAYSLCKPGTLQEFGMREMVAFSGLAGGLGLHIHENSRHVIEDVVNIPGLRNVTFSDAVGYTRSFDIRWELRRRMENVPITFFCTKLEFLDALEASTLPGNARYVFSAESKSEAQRIMEKVRSYRAPEENHNKDV